MRPLATGDMRHPEPPDDRKDTASASQQAMLDGLPHLLAIHPRRVPVVVPELRQARART